MDLTIPAHREINYRVGMQAGATLVYAWSTGRGGELLTGEFPGKNIRHPREGHGAFEASSSGWYTWHWKNPTSDAVTVHLKLSGSYEPSAMPYDR